MREILFHGKRVDNEEWIVGHLIWFEDGRARITPRHTEIFSNESGESIYHIAYEVIPKTIGQYTGLNDGTKWEQLTKEEQSDWLKNYTVEEWNGKKIFEGDVLSMERFFDDEPKTKTVWKVVYNDKYASYTINRGSFIRELSQGNVNYYNAEVIGTIHDNPELLGGDV